MFQQKVVDSLDLVPTQGDFGIEIEMECQNPIKLSSNASLIWGQTSDGSLRGPFAAELVLKSPLNMNNILPSLELVRSCQEKYGFSITPSIRAGVHVHLNMQDHTVMEVFKLMAVYYPLETVLTRFCGEGRSGNLFALRARDAQAATNAAYRAVKRGDLYVLRNQAYRYASMNLQSLFQHGSVEFRAFGTPTDVTDIHTWVQILDKMKNYAVSVKDSWENMSKISGEGAEGYLLGIFGQELYQKLHYPGIEEDVIDDMRDAQMFCHQLSMREKECGVLE